MQHIRRPSFNSLVALTLFPRCVAAAVLAVPGTAVAQSGKMAQNRAELDLTSGNGPGVMYMEHGTPELVGWTYKYIESSGEFEAVKPAFTVVLSDQTGPGNGSFQFWRYSNSEETFQRSSLSASVSYNSRIVSMAAHYAHTEDVIEGTFGASVFLGFEVDYPASLADLATETNIVFNPEAEAILKNTSMNQQEKAIAWEQAGFGPLIAFGADLRGHLGLHLTLNHADSYSARADFFSLIAEYNNWGASLTFEDALTRLVTHNEISLGLDYEGLTEDEIANLSPPTLEMIQNEDLLGQWIANVWSVATGAKGFKGLYLAPVSALQGGPDVNTPPWDEFLLQEAATVASEALHGLSIISQWNQPYSLRGYMQERINPVSGRSFWADLLLVRGDVVSGLDVLRSAVVDYLSGDNYCDSAYSDMVRSAIEQVRAADTQVWPFRQQFEAFANSLPALTLDQEVYWHSDGPGGWVWIPVSVDLQGAGFFRDGSLADLEEALREDRLVIYADPLYNHGQLQSSTGGIRNLFIERADTIYGGSKDDLLNIKFHFEVRLNSSSRYLDLRIEDDLGRAVVDRFSWGM